MYPEPNVRLPNQFLTIPPPTNVCGIVLGPTWVLNVFVDDTGGDWKILYFKVYVNNPQYTVYKYIYKQKWNL